MSMLDGLVDAIWSKSSAKLTKKQRDAAARTVVNNFSYGCALVSVSPIPFSDALVMLPFQSMMVMSVGHIYGRKITSAGAKELVAELGATAGAGLLARQGIKALLPVLGPMLTMPAAFAANWAIGRVAMAHFEDPEASRERLVRVYAEAKEEAATLFSRAALEKLRTRTTTRRRAKKAKTAGAGRRRQRAR
mgnify:CR=1 FL=1